MDWIAPTPPKFIHWNPNPCPGKLTLSPLFKFLSTHPFRILEPARPCFLSPGYSSLPRGPQYPPDWPICHEHPWTSCSHTAIGMSFFFSQATSVLNHSPLPITNYSKFHKLNLIFLYFIPSDPPIVPLVAQWMALWHLTQETPSENLAQFTTCIFPDYAWNRMVLLTSWSGPATLQKQPRVLYLQ